jgi:chromate transporter
LRLTAFDGTVAHIAMMDEEFVGRRRWITHEEFVDMTGATKLIPGPSSTQMKPFISAIKTVGQD